MDTQTKDSILGIALENAMLTKGKMVRTKSFVAIAQTKFPATYGPQFKEVGILMDEVTNGAQAVHDALTGIVESEPSNRSARANNFQSTPEPVAVTRARNRLMRAIQGEVCDLDSASDRKALADWLVNFTTEYRETVRGNWSTTLGDVPVVAEAVCDPDEFAGMGLPDDEPDEEPE